jgi:hypothetical protein
LAIDLFCGLGGWTEGLLAEGYRVVGYDVDAHVYDDERYPAELVLQDVLTVNGAQFVDAALIVASPPCQRYSYMAMPWTRAKAIAADIRADETGALLAELNKLFDACFRIQREASAAAGHHIPMVVENVRGAIPWVGRSRWNYGSFHLWGDVPALMPPIAKAIKVPGFRFDGRSTCFQQAAVEGLKNSGGSWFGVDPRGNASAARNPARGVAIGEGVRDDGRKRRDEADGYDRTHPAAFGWKSPRTSSTATSARKAASARIAKIPLTLSRWIAAHYRP